MAAYHWVYEFVSCRLTTKKLGSALCPMLIIEYVTALLLHASLSFVEHRTIKLL